MSEKKYKESKEERIAYYRAMQYAEKHRGEELPSDPASDGIEDDDTINAAWMAFWSGDD